MTIGEIFIKLGFHADTFTLKDFSKALGELPMKAVTSALGIAGVSLEVASLVKNAMEAATGFQMFTTITGESSRELQRWQNVAKQVVGSSQGVTSSFYGVDNAIKRMKSGAGSAELGNAFGFLHLDWKTKSVDQIMNDIRKSIPGMTKKQLDWAQTRAFPALGIDAGTIMSLGNLHDFNKRADAVPVMDQGQIKSVMELQTAFAKLAGTIEHSVVPMMDLLAESINRVLPYLKNWLDTEVKSIVKIAHMTPEDSKSVDDYISKGTDEDTDALLKQHPHGLVWDWIKGMLPQPALAYSGGPRMPTEQRDLNLIQNIYSTGDPAAVAYHAIAEADRRLTQTSKHYDNGGH